MARRSKRPTLIGKVSVGPVAEDTRFPNPFFFTVMTQGDKSTHVEHERFPTQEKADQARDLRIRQLRSARKRRKD